jgi:hypothetical protein
MERDRTEERIDRLEGEIGEFRVETNARFDKVDARFEKVNEEFVAVRKEIKEGFESQQRTMLHGALMICGSMIGCFGAIAGLLATAV